MELNSLDPNVLIILEILKANKEESIKTEIMFQKIAFLLLINFQTLFNVADFKPHKFGPYSESLKKTKDQLIKMGDIKKGVRNEFLISENGVMKLKQIETQLDKKYLKNLKIRIQDVKEGFNNFSNDEILAYIYKAFPEYVEPSIKAEELNYENLFLNLYNRGKLGIASIAKLMGFSIEEAIEWVKKHTKPIVLR